MLTLGFITGLNLAKHYDRGESFIYKEQKALFQYQTRFSMLIVMFVQASN